MNDSKTPIQVHVEWLHNVLRENGLCIDGGTCHHGCKPDGKCFREGCCAPLSGSSLDDNWKLHNVNVGSICEVITSLMGNKDYDNAYKLSRALFGIEE